MSLSNSNLLLDNRHGVTCTAILPIELWSYVFQFTSKADLLTLCVVSRSFHQEAERALYRDINLSDTKLYAWAEKVAQRLDLAACVQTLALSISQFPQVQIIGLKSVHEALQVLPNLKDLTLRSAPTGLCFSPSYAWLLSGCSFRLKAFRNSMFDLSPIISFLASQPDICLWEQQSATPFDFTDEILPNLTSVSVPLWLVDKLKLPRPIQEMSFSMGLMEKMEEVKFISSLGRYKDTTTKLRMERWVSEDSMLLEHFISCLAEYVPYIEYFSIFSIGVSESQSEVDDVAQAFSKFQRLHTLELSPHSDGMGFRSLYRALLDGSGRYRVALRFMAYCPSIRRVGLLSVNGRLSWYARSKKDALAGDLLVYV